MFTKVIGSEKINQIMQNEGSMHRTQKNRRDEIVLLRRNEEISMSIVSTF